MKVNIMKGMAAEQILIIVLCVVVVAGLAYWFWTTWGQGTAVMSQQQCQLTKMTSCNSYKDSARPAKMTTSYKCYMGKPAGCGCPATEKNVWHNDVEMSVSSGNVNWWDCIAPGCNQNYGIRIYSSNDCD